MSRTHCDCGNVWLEPSSPWPGGSNPHCFPCWRAAGGVRTVRAKTPAARRGRCDHLGKRTEFRAGCGGWMCEHTCDAGEPKAVPGGVCLTCTKWEPVS